MPASKAGDGLFGSNIDTALVAALGGPVHWDDLCDELERSTKAKTRDVVRGVLRALYERRLLRPVPFAGLEWELTPAGRKCAEAILLLDAFEPRDDTTPLPVMGG